MSEDFDTLELRVRDELFVRWSEPGSWGFQQVEILINGTPLIDLVHVAELPWAEREYDERLAEGETVENLGQRGELAGDYLYLSPGETFFPCENFFGTPYDTGFELQSDDPVSQKSLLLSCTCGVTVCWFLLAKITCNEQQVVWSDFEQFHRDWDYDLGPFTFDAEQYKKTFRWRETNV